MAKRKISERQRRIYRRRRIMAAIIAFFLLVGMVWGIRAGVRSLNRWHRENDEVTTTRSAVPKPASSDGGSKRSKKKLPIASGKKTSVPKKKSVPNCSSLNTQLSLTAPDPTTTVGGYIDFTAVISHKGSDSCLIDASNNSRVLVISSGEQTIWRSDSCPVDNRLLLMAQGDHDDQPMRWNANASGSQCIAENAMLKVNPGTYKAQLILKSDPEVKSQMVPLLVK